MANEVSRRTDVGRPAEAKRERAGSQGTPPTVFYWGSGTTSVSSGFPLLRRAVRTKRSIRASSRTILRKVTSLILFTSGPFRVSQHRLSGTGYGMEALFCAAEERSSLCHAKEKRGQLLACCFHAEPRLGRLARRARQKTRWIDFPDGIFRSFSRRRCFAAVSTSVWQFQP